MSNLIKFIYLEVAILVMGGKTYRTWYSTEGKTFRNKKRNNIQHTFRQNLLRFIVSLCKLTIKRK
jgi:hypothetical protein